MNEIVKLSWEILRAKYWYYIMDEPIMSDLDYDALEKRYDALCKEAGVSPKASDMVGFDTSRPACWAVMAKERGLSFEQFNRRKDEKSSK